MEAYSSTARAPIAIWAPRVRASAAAQTASGNTATMVTPARTASKT
jgi:hypothetical protein